MEVDHSILDIPSPAPRIPSPPPPKFMATGRPQRQYRLPARYRDVLPEPPLPAAEPKPEPLVHRMFLLVQNQFQTAVNSFGLWRDYLYRPSYDPEAFISPEDFGGSGKSDQEINRLVEDVLLHPEFRAEDLKGFNAQRENHRADEYIPKSSYLEKFTETSVEIEVPSGDKTIPPRCFSVPGLLYCKLMSVIHAAFADPLAVKFHLSL
ncbi:hypothetical protein Hypma_012075 [Hypsizygus marmoreus]|uniref:Uncharacterized protein n=1 Tax=Hypsizygus marmoreus TaxID=39966 RepID=A0A369JKB5_HYPMA|nr:hypothetical protein Hypma_012075 [Hypsizygus marmoreus]